VFWHGQSFKWVPKNKGIVFTKAINQLLMKGEGLGRYTEAAFHFAQKTP
jgi:hypothetical protein